jgi:hypothetical protein
MLKLPFADSMGPLAGSAGASLYSGCVRNQSFSAFLGTLGQKPVALCDKQHLPAGFQIAHGAGDL